ncbi:DUF6230 family protein [Streptomyces gobitricini]|uniref:DUF6230 family protein n=1 Tax=Streptomyces gobitricini TaxID=68211 RepID=UPI0031D9875D
MAFAVSGSSFTVTADHLDGHNAVQYISTDVELDGTRHPVAVAAISRARLKNMCQFAVTRTPVGPVALVVRGGGAEPVQAEDLVIDLDRITGDMRFEQARMGQDASTLDGQAGAQGLQGVFGQRVGRLVVKDMRLRAWSLTAGVLKLKQATLAISLEESPCG